MTVLRIPREPKNTDSNSTKKKAQLIVKKMCKYSVIVMYDKLKSNDCRDGSVGSACLTLIGT